MVSEKYCQFKTKAAKSRFCFACGRTWACHRPLAGSRLQAGNHEPSGYIFASLRYNEGVRLKYKGGRTWT
jgi:hypothetical protein